MQVLPVTRLSSTRVWIWQDPEHNLALFNALDQFADTGHPLLVGVSRKSMIGQMLDSDVDQRLIGSVTMALLAAQSLVRVPAQTPLIKV